MSDGFNIDILKHLRGLEFMNLYAESGRVKKVLGPVVEGILPGATVGGICQIVQQNQAPIEAEVVGFRDRTALLMPLQAIEGISMGARIERGKRAAEVAVGSWMLGRLLDGSGRPLDASFRVEEQSPLEYRPIRQAPLVPTERRAIVERFETGVRAIDAATPLGLGQRIAIMAASGVGKSMLMGMLARQSRADINVIALIGERGREVTEFIERDLGPEGLSRSIVVAVTSDESPVLKVRGAYVATAIAEYFRDQGANCVLMMDSVTRFAMALREIGLAAGEPPTTKGYTPSVFGQLPKLLERAGAKKGSGSITGLYTVLVEGNDFDDPVADSVRSILDGHIVLSRDLATRNHYPAIDVLGSVSRLNSAVAAEEEQALNSEIRDVLAAYAEAEDLINIGGYRKGNNPRWDRAIELYPEVVSLLRQKPNETSNLGDLGERLRSIFRG